MTPPPNDPENAAPPAGRLASQETESPGPSNVTPPPPDRAPPGLDDTLPAAPPAPAERFGKYLLVRCIAEGGMGAVYHAKETSPDDPNRVLREVAIKRILRERTRSQDAVERFRIETRAAMSLNHDGIVAVHEAGEVCGEHYFSMLYVSGGNLNQYVTPGPKGKRLTFRQAARVIALVADAVQYAHDQRPQIIHRDIKPQNIVLQPASRSSGDFTIDDSRLEFTPKLTDFGLARLVTEDSSLSLSQQGQAMGTPGYMPREQAAGDLKQMGPWSDIYSLGAVLYALLTGRPPFPVNPSVNVIEILRQVQELDPTPPRRLNPDVPSELEDICLKCLEKEPARRYASARQLGEALDDWLHGRHPIRHTPRRSGWLFRTRHRLARSVRRHPWRAAYLAASAAVILGLAATLLIDMARQGRLVGGLRREAEALVEAARREEREGGRYRALKHYHEAEAKYRELFARSPADQAALDSQLQLVDIYLGRGELLRRELKHADARAEYEAALSLLSDLARAGAGKARLDPVRAEVLHKLGELSGAQGRRREALRYYRQALPIRQALSDGSPDDPGFRRDLARNYGYMGDVQLELGDAAGAKASYDQAAAIRQENVDRAAGPGELLLAKCQRARDFGNMAAYFAWTGKPGEAVEWHQRRLDYYNGAPFPQDGPLEGAFRTDRADCRAALADLLLDLGRQAEARPPLDEALMEYKQLLSRDPESTELKAGEAYALLVRGKALATAGKNAEASRAIGRVRAALEDLLAAARATPQPENEYRLAVANAWLGLLEPDAVSAAVSNDRAMTALSNAVKGGFLDLERLGREGGFRRLREGERTREAFRDLVRQLTTAREPG